MMRKTLPIATAAGLLIATTALGYVQSSSGRMPEIAVPPGVWAA